MNFPNYNLLRSRAEKMEDLPIVGIESIKLRVLHIRPEDKEDLEYIYALIIHHAAISNDGWISENSIPYAGQLASEMGGVTFSLERLPNLLWRIIFCYLQQRLEG